jgi:arylsulfatase A-like enzyme
LFVARGVGAFARLHGEHRPLALASLAAGVLGGGALGGSLMLLQATRDRPSPCARLDWRVRAGAAALGLIVATVLNVYQNAAFWLLGYPVARQALFTTSWLLIFVVGRMLVEGVTLSRGVMPGIAAILAALAGIGSLTTLRGGDSRFAQLMTEGPSEHWVTLLRAATDWDGDGSSGWFGGGDCAPLDPRVSPRAREVPGNGVDDNCRFGDGARAALLPMPPSAPPSTPSPLNVVLVTLDAVRADHTTPYGYGRDTTPTLARLARQGTLYRRAYPPGGWTCITLPAIFGGVHARRFRYESQAVTTERRVVPLPWREHVHSGEGVAGMLSIADLSGRWTLPSALRSRGMTTAAVTNNRYVPVMARGLGTGWDTQEWPPGDDDEQVADLAIQRLRSLASRPFFLWVHLYDAHDPQTHHEGIPEFGPEMLDKYDHEIRAVDHALGRILDVLEEVSTRPTALIVAADHGEVFHMGYQFHGNDLFEDGLRVPLLVRVPGRPAAEVGSVVTLLDIAPTILTLTVTPIPVGLEGVSLLTPRPARVAITDLWRINERNEVYLDQIAAVDQDYRLILDRKRQTATLASTGDLSRPPKLLSASRAPGLRRAIDSYLEQELVGP